MTDTIHDSLELAAGIPIVVIVPALVELAKRQGLPDRFAGIGALVIATWVLGGIVYGLAAAGLYSQRGILLPRDRSIPDVS